MISDSGLHDCQVAPSALPKTDGEDPRGAGAYHVTPLAGRTDFAFNFFSAEKMT